MKLILSTRDSLGRVILEGVQYYWFEHNNILGIRFTDDTIRLYPLTNIWYVGMTVEDLKECTVTRKE